MEHSQRITSARNDRFLEFLALRTRADRAVRGAFLLDGEKLAREALSSNRAKALLVDERRSDAFQTLIYDAITSAVEVVYLASNLIERLSDTPSPQGVIAVASLPSPTPPEGLGPRALVLDGLQDPGNVGTILRTADAAGCTGILMTDTCADAYSMKAVRASMGSVFRMSVCVSSAVAAVVSAWRDNGTHVIVADADGIPYSQVNRVESWALVIGSEGKGVSPGLAVLADETVSIPMRDPVESLNAAVAAGILLYSLCVVK
ncbi:23S rRNA methyltransferase [Clostridia bacterium]|nr:23S rRNA methyltransferase [Clostridia bacterium]